MALTRAQVEAVLARRVGLLMSRAGLDGNTTAGANLDMNEPIRLALHSLGFAVLDPLTVADVDVAAVDHYTTERLLDLAELRIDERIADRWYLARNAYGDPDDAAAWKPDGAAYLAWHGDRQGLRTRIAELKQIILRPYVPAIGPSAAGVITVGSTLPNDPARLNPYGWPYP